MRKKIMIIYLFISFIILTSTHIFGAVENKNFNEDFIDKCAWSGNNSNSPIAEISCVDLSNFKSAKLSFDYLIYFGDKTNVFGGLYISSDSYGPWISLKSYQKSTFNWSREKIDIPLDFLGDSTVFFRFKYWLSLSLLKDGWFVDNIVIDGISLSDEYVLVYFNDFNNYGLGDSWGDWIIIDKNEAINHPPDKPDAPSPSNGAFNLSFSVDLSCNVSDIDKDKMDVYFYNAEDNSLIGTDYDVSSGDRATVEWNGLKGSTTYIWYVKASDRINITQSDTWNFTTKAPGPDLKCYGELSWTGITPGTEITGSFTIRNIGDSGSLLDWNITSYPDWGVEWTFNPESGEDLTPEDGEVIVQVSVIAPNLKTKTFTGTIVITNRQDSNDKEILSVYLATPKNKLYNNALLQQIIQKLFNRFLLLEKILNQIVL